MYYSQTRSRFKDVTAKAEKHRIRWNTCLKNENLSGRARETRARSLVFT